jgi:hypothetical protein
MTFSTPPDLTISGAEDLFGTTNNLAYVITSMHVYFSGDYPAKRDSVGIRLWRNGEPLWGWRPPNDTYSVIDFGTGLLFEETQEPVSFKIDVTDRGGHDTGWQNSIHVDFYGYRIKKQ